jgi:hypothetical protein
MFATTHHFRATRTRGGWPIRTIPRYPAADIILWSGIRPHEVEDAVAIDEQHVALPKLYGAPAYARPVAPVEPTLRPIDPDDLPIEAFRTDEEQELASALPAYAFSGGGSMATGQQAAYPASGDPELRPKALSLKKIAGRIRGGDS